jgi:hypothetical protein
MMDNLQLNALCEYEERLNGNTILPETTDNIENQKMNKFNEYINNMNNQLNTFVIEFNVKSS